MRNYLLKYSFIGGYILIITFLIGCSSKLNDVEESTSSNQNTQNSLELFNQNLVGTWKTDCYERNTSSYMRYILTITNSSIKVSGGGSNDSLCSSFTSDFSYTFTYEIGDLLDESNPTKRKIDLNLDSLIAIARSSGVVSYFNTNEYCTFSNWQLNVLQNTLGKDCSQINNNQYGLIKLFPPAAVHRSNIEYSQNEDVFQIIKVTKDTSGNDVLFFGDPSTGDSTTISTRPISFSETVYVDPDGDSNYDTLIDFIFYKQ